MGDEAAAEPQFVSGKGTVVTGTLPDVGFVMGSEQEEFPLDDELEEAAAQAVVDAVKAEPEADETDPKPKPVFAVPDMKTGGAPVWARVPKALKFPRGRRVFFLRFNAEWTDTPWVGHPMPDMDGTWRQCILWALTDVDEKMALGRAMGDSNRAPAQLAKQMVRAIDGHVADWSGALGDANIDRWWTQIGGKCRQQLIRLYAQLHVLSREDQQTFFESCIEVRSTG